MEEITLLCVQKLVEDLMHSSSSSDEDDDIFAVLSEINQKRKTEKSTNNTEISVVLRKKTSLQETDNLSEIPEKKEVFTDKNTPHLTNNLGVSENIVKELTENQLELKAKEFVNNLMNSISECEFKQKFQFSRDSAIYLMEEYSLWSINSCYRGNGNKSIVETNILSFLWFCTNGTTVREVAEVFSISISYMQKSLKNVLKFLIDELAPKNINFPKTSNDKEAIAKDFENVAGFPNVLGCVDECYFPVRLSKLSTECAGSYICLRGICDSKLRFLNVKTGVPGEISDPFMEKDLPKLCFPKYQLLGSEKCPLREYLMIPYSSEDNLDESEKHFNRKLYRTHVKIKNAFGILRSRFRQLKYLKNIQTVEMMCDFIIACCILHNICIDRQDYHNDQNYTDVSDRVYPSSLASIKSEDFLTDLGLMKRYELKHILFKTNSSR